MLDIGRSIARFTWGMTVFGAQTIADLVPSGKGAPRTGPAAAMDAVTDAMRSEMSGEAKGSGDPAARSFGADQLSQVAQKIAQNPKAAFLMRKSMPSMVWGMTAAMPGRSARIAREECQNKMDIMRMVEEVGTVVPPKGVYVPLADLVANSYAAGEFPSLWLIEGLGHYYAESFMGQGETSRDLLTAQDVEGLPIGSLTMLHAGIGLAFAQHGLEIISPDIPASQVRRLIERFVGECRTSSREGFAGCALESLGLVVRHFHGAAVCRSLDPRLAEIDPALQGFFWHGVGRALYFSPANMMPGLDSPWPVLAMIEEEAPHETARRNMVSGMAWAMTLVNMLTPGIMEAFLKENGEKFSVDDAFTEGVASAIVMRQDTTPGASFIGAFLRHRPSDEKTAALWSRLIVAPATKALERYHRVLEENRRLDEVFRYQPLEELVAGLEKRAGVPAARG